MNEQQHSIEYRKLKLIQLITQLEDIDTLISIETLLMPPKTEAVQDELLDEPDDETKELLTKRIQNHKNAPEKAKPWEEVEQRLMNKYDYEV